MKAIVIGASKTWVTEQIATDSGGFASYTESPMIVIGGEITEGTPGTFTVAALTCLLRSTDSVIGDLKELTLAEQANQAITTADTTYYVSLNYNDGVTPTITLNTSNPYVADKRNIPIGKVMKDSSDVVHFISGGYDLQDGVRKLHARAMMLSGHGLASGAAMAYAGTNNFAISEGICLAGVNQYTLDAYTSISETFIPVYVDVAGTGWTEGTDRNTIDYEHYDDGSGTLAEVGTAKFGAHWIYRHIDDGDVYVVYGSGSYSLAESKTSEEPAKPQHLTDFGVLIGRIIAPQGGGSFTDIRSAIDTAFVGSSVDDHAGLSNLDYAGSGHTGFQPELTEGAFENGDKTALDGIPAKVNPLALSQGANLTAAASGSNGIQVANNDDINFGTGDYSIFIPVSVPDWTPTADQTLYHKHDGTNGLIVLLLTTGKIRITINADSYDSTVAPTVSDGNQALIGVSVTTESASVAGNVLFTFNGAALGVAVAITAGTPTTVDNTATAYIMGTSATRTASTTLAAYAYNYALDADQVRDLYRVGVAMSDRDGSMTPLNISTTINTSFDTFDGASSTGFHAVHSTSGTQYCGTADEIPWTQGKVFLIVFDATIASGTIRYSPRNSPSGSAISEEGSVDVIEGRNLQIATINSGVFGLGVLTFVSSINSELTVSNLEIIPLGTTLRLEPENIQLSPGQWLDAANGHHAKLPAEGATLIRPQSDGEIKWTNTWVASSAGQYIGGINENIFPSENIRIEWISIQTATTGVSIIIGDQTDTDRYVEAVALVEELDISSPVNRNHDGTNLKLVITPSGTYTGSITTTIKYKLIG